MKASFLFSNFIFTLNLHHQTEDREKYMLYKPNYCCHCGEKVERIEWFPWTSGRFCETCDKEFKIRELIPALVVAFGIMLSVFGLGTYLKSEGGQMPVAVKRKTADAPKPSVNPGNQKAVLPMSANVQPQPTAAVENQTKQVGQPKMPIIQTKSEAKEAVYFCGAQTKKGTPCSRRVKGGGRCYQHEGQPALLAPEKLLASQ